MSNCKCKANLPRTETKQAFTSDLLCKSFHQFTVHLVWLGSHLVASKMKMHIRNIKTMAYNQYQAVSPKSFTQYFPNYFATLLTYGNPCQPSIANSNVFECSSLPVYDAISVVLAPCPAQDFQFLAPWLWILVLLSACGRAEGGEKQHGWMLVQFALPIPPTTSMLFLYPSFAVVFHKGKVVKDQSPPFLNTVWTQKEHIQIRGHKMNIVLGCRSCLLGLFVKYCIQ